MSDKELLTVKEYAEAAGVTQQAVYKRLNKGLAKFVVEVEGQKYIKTEALAEIKGKDQQQPDPQKQTLNESDISKLIDTLTQTIDLLQGQLAIKDSQIKDLNDRLEQALNNTSQSQYITAQVQALDASEPKEEPKETTVNEPAAEPVKPAPTPKPAPKTKKRPPERKSLLKRLFGG